MKKLLCMLLVAAMLLSFMPAFSLQAAAADGAEEVAIEEVAIAQPEEKAVNTKAATQAVRVIDLDGAPNHIAPGAATEPNIYEYEDDVAITDVKWLDANKQPVTEFVQDETYWLAVTVAPDAGYAFTETPDTIYSNGKEYELQILSQQEAVMYICYIAQLTTGNINIIPTGFREGAPIAGASVTIEGKAVLAEIRIEKIEYDEEDEDYHYFDVTEGNFEPDSLYDIAFILQPMDGYAFDGREDVYTVNGKWVSYGHDADELWLYWAFCTGEEIAEVALSMTEIAPGMKVEDVELTVPAGANYVVSYYNFHDENGTMEEGDIFQENQRYELSYRLMPKNGYCFADEVSVTLNGKPNSPSSNSNAAEVYDWVYFYLEPAEHIRLYDLPYEIEAGAAEVPEIDDYTEDDVTITNVQWVNADKQPVTVFDEGKIYYLAITVTAQGYGISKEPNVITYDERYDEHEWSFEWVDKTTGIVYVRYSAETCVGDVEITISGIEEGAKIADIQVTVTGNATLKSIEVYEAVYENKAYFDYVLTNDTAFKTGKFYSVKFVLEPKIGYRFGGEYDVYINGRTSGIDDCSETAISVSQDLFTGEDIESVELIVTGLAPGAKREDVIVTIPEDANYILVSGRTYFTDVNGNKYEWDTFQKDEEYILEYCIVPKEGYRFDGWNIFINGSKANYGSYLENGLGIFGEEPISFYEDCIKVEELPHNIWEGAEENESIWNAEDVQVSGGVAITGTRWLGADKKPVTKFENGKGYYLELTLTSTNAATFTDTPKVEFSRWSDSHYVYELEIISETQVIIYIYYSLEPLAGNLDIQITGLREGAKIEDLKATVSGNATVEEILVYQYGDYYGSGYLEWFQVTEGTFESANNYSLECIIRANPGYSFWGDDYHRVTINGEGTARELFGGNMYIRCETGFSTCEKIESAALTVPKAELGKNIEDLVVTAPKNANYTVEYRWYDVTDDWNEATGKIEKKHKYQVEISLTPKPGYIFAEDMEVTINGANTYEFYVENYGLRAEVREYYSFLEKITKIELPAMPKSVSLGSTLPTDFAVDDSKNYTVYGYWRRNYEWVEKATEKGIYQLVICAEPKPGYEFAEDAKVYVGGTLVEDPDVSNGYCSAYGTYYVGLEKIAKVELSYTEPQAGKAASTVKTPSNAKYTIIWQGWGQGETNDVEQCQEVETYIKGQYVFVGVDLQPKDGYAITEDTAFYLNGKKVTPLSVNNYDGATYIVFALGKVSGVTPLDAPQLTLTVNSSGKPVISWAKVTGAKKYEIWRSVNGGDFKKLYTGTKTTYTDSKAAAGSEYTYKVKTIGSKSEYNSDFSETVSCYATFAAPSLKMKVDSKTGIPTLSWKKISGASGYAIYRSANGGEYELLTTTTAVSYKDSSVQADNTYSYHVVTLGKAEEYNSAASAVKSTTLAVKTPKLTGSATPDGKPVISWAAVEGAEKYEIYRSTKSSKGYTLLAEVEGTSYTDTSVATGKPFYYKVAAVGTNTESAQSSYLKMVGKCATTTIQVAIDEDSGKPMISWEKVEGAKEYIIYRATSETGKYSKLKTVKTLSHIDTKASVGTKYFYKVVAKASAKGTESNYSNIENAFTICAKAVVTVKVDTKTGKLSLSWKKVTGAKTYEVYRSENGGEYVLVATQKTNSYKDTSTVAGNVYRYQVKVIASKAGADSFLSAEKTALACAQPKVKGKVGATGKPELTWGAVEGATQYVIYRSTSSSKGYEVLAVTEDLTYTDATAVKGKTYYYKIAPVSNETEGTLSSSARVKSK